MASVKFGGGVTAMSGSIAGSVFARNRFGFYIRPRTKPVNPRSDRQSAARTLMKLLTDYWNSAAMSDAERGAWITYAAAIAMKNRLGEVMYCTGFNHFIRSNTARILVDGALIEAGPTVLSLPGADNTIVMTADATAELLTVAFDDTQDWCKETGGFLSVSMGQPQLHTRNFFGGPYRNAGAIVGNTDVPITSPQTLTPPFTLVTGQKVFAFARIIRADGRVSNPFNFPALTVGALETLYSVQNSTLPDFNCNHPILCALNGKPCYRRANSTSYLWWDGTSKWILSELLGVTGTDYQERANANPVGLYTLKGEATGAATVSAGECPP